MVYIVFTDRLGNNLFQFAAARSLSEDVTICVPNEDEYKSVLKYSDVFFSGIPIVNTLPQDVVVYEEPYFTYNPLPEVHKNVVLRGYFQSYKYFDIKLLRKYYSPVLSKRKELGEVIEKFKDGETITSVHVRRGDYLNMLYKHPFCGEKYYVDAMNTVGGDSKFLFFSDDIQWCKRKFKGSNIFYSEGRSFLDDFYMQSLCDNNIISNSSFSYWASMINSNENKMVICPQTWFGDCVDYCINDIVPDSFVKLKTVHGLLYKTKVFLQRVRLKLIYILNK